MELTGIQQVTKKRKVRRRWGVAVRAAAVAVALCTVNALVLPALTMESERPTFCGQAAHTHGDGCYQSPQPQLTCTIAQGHVHTDECYETVLVCTLPEQAAPAPAAVEQTQAEGSTEGTQPAAAGETLPEAAAETQPEGHTHSDGCYQRRLVCQIPEGHVHTDGCYAPAETAEQTLVCPLAEHTHTLACCSDPAADKETSADWESTLPAEKTGMWAWDLVAVAQSQLGYAESEKNYQVQPDGVTTLGYTRYGDWYGIPYGDWCAMFVSFCLNYAGIPREQMPIESSVPRWAQSLLEQNKLYHPSEHTPKPGDLVFYDGDGDGEPEHMGIVEQTGSSLVVIEGNTSSNVVERVTYQADSPLLYAVAPCPVNPEDLTTATYEGQDFTVTAVYGSDARIPADAQLRASEYAPDSETYRRRVEEMTARYGLTPEEREKIRLFSIGFYQGDTEVEPSAPVEVTLTYADASRADSGCSVAHFGAELEQVEAQVSFADGMRTLHFTLGSFSDVAVMPLSTDLNNSQGFALISYTKTVDGQKNSALLPVARDSQTLDGMEIDGEFRASTVAGGEFPDFTLVVGDKAAMDQYQKELMVWQFSKATFGDTYRIYAEVNGTPQYIVLDENGLSLTTTYLKASRFTVKIDQDGKTLAFQSGNYYINRQGYDEFFGKWDKYGNNDRFYLVSKLETPNFFTGETPSGTVINLFDYWRTDRVPDADVSGVISQGINSGHALKFCGGNGKSEANDWTGNGGGALQGIVSDRLGPDGYPVLSGNQTILGGEQDGTDLKESLAYLFDPDMENSYRKAFENVGGLLQVDPEGYYYYDSTKNYAYFDEADRRFTLYNMPSPAEKGEFFPFNKFGDSSKNFYFGLTLTTRFINRYDGYADASKKKPMVFEFSGDDDVWIFVDDVLVADLGGIHDAVKVKIDFAKGSVVIDKVGQANHTSGQTKNFSEIFKDSSVNLENGRLENNSYHTLKFFYMERGAGKSNLNLKYNLASIPTTGVYKVDQHGDAIPGAKFAVYAAEKDESGEYQYLSDLKVNGGKKVLRSEIAFPIYNQNGDILDKNGKVVVKALYTGTTNARGEMIFRDSYGGALSMDELEKMFGTHFLLREIEVPDGYRLVDIESCMYIENKTLLTDDTYSSGVYNAATELLSAPNTLYLIERDGHTYKNASRHYDADGKETQPVDQGLTYGEVPFYNGSEPKGTLFAVVQKFDIGSDATWVELQNDDYWKAIYGSGVQGYQTVSHEGGRDGLLTAAINAAQEQQAIPYGNGAVFQPAPSGAMELELKNLPGQLQDYYWYLVNNKKLNPNNPADQAEIAQQTRFTVSVYWTEGELADATPANTWQVSAETNPATRIQPFNRAFGASVEIPNIVNRMMLQKVDAEGKGVNGAWFGMYPAGTAGGRLYYQAETGEKILLNEDGTAQTLDTNGNPGMAKGTYVVDPKTGGIEVTFAGGVTYQIRPQKDFEGKPIVGETANNSEVRESSGVLDLMGIPDGNYCLREVKAPDGYLLNPAQIMVRVDNQGIYINAGTENDGISVALGPGRLISSMQHLASEGEVDRTLHWIYTVIKSNTDQANTFDFTTGDVATGANNWKYLNKNGMPLNPNIPDVDAAVKAGAMRNYLKYDPNRQGLQNYSSHTYGHLPDQSEGIVGDLLLEAQAGWTALVIRQDYEYGSTYGKGAFNYDNLKGKPISKLFSLAKMVKVTDQRTSSLSIEKRVEHAPQTEAVPVFQFDVTLTTGTGTPVVGTFPMTRTTADGQTREEPITFTDGKARLSLSHGEKVLISGLPERANYTVTEQANASYAPSYTIEGGNKQAGNTALGTLVWIAEPLDYTTELVFTNTYQTTINMVKHDSSNQATLLPGAKFTLQNEQKLYYQANGGFGTEKAELTTDQSGQIQFANLPDGTYTLTETKAPDGYARLTHPVMITVNAAKITSATINATPLTISADQLTVYVPNSVGIELPQTGGVGTTGITTLGLGLLILAGAILLYRKRKGAVSNS